VKARLKPILTPSLLSKGPLPGIGSSRLTRFLNRALPSAAPCSVINQPATEDVYDLH
jgi:hypothetical protein